MISKIASGVFSSLLSLLFLFFCNDTTAQRNSLRDKIEAIIPAAKGTVGVAIRGWGEKDTLTFIGHGHFPMQSVYKFHLALTVLHSVDAGRFSLGQMIHIDKKDLLPNTWSPLRDKYPEGNVDISLGELIRFTVAQSDNNGCDILFRKVGGPAAVDQYIHSLGVKAVAIAATEEEMHKDWDTQFTNWSEPLALVQLLELFDHGNILSQPNHDFLWKAMTETSLGASRIKSMLPEGTVVAHKTGSSGTNAQGITAATNDVGIVVLPNGKHYVLVVLVSGSIADEKTRDSAMARISNEVWHYFSEKK